MSRRPVAWLAALSATTLGAAILWGAAAADPGGGREVFTFTDPEIVESSGLVAGVGADDLFVTVNDSGDGARVFAVDPRSGDTVGVTTWPGQAVDVEALAPAGEDAVWVGDIGDNLAGRDTITVTRVPVGASDRAVDGESFELRYPDGAHDAETLLVHPRTGRLFVAVKEFIGRLYAAPRRLDPDGPNELTRVDDILGISTDGAFFPDARHVIVRNYGQAAVYTWPELERLETFDLPAQPQGEAIAVSADGEVFVSSEGEGEPVLQVELPESVRTAMAADNAGGGSGDGTGEGKGAGERADRSDGDGERPDGVQWPWLVGGLLLVIAVVTVTVVAIGGVATLVWRSRPPSS